jgi:hypothetical protein
MTTKPPYRPVGGFITETPSPRHTPKSAFLKRLEREQKAAAQRERDKQTVWFSGPHKVVPFRRKV